MANRILTALMAGSVLVGAAYGTAYVYPSFNTVDAHAEATRTTVMVETDTGHGTGIVVGEGKILTANHVIEGATKITITYDDGTKAEAGVLWAESTGNDVALLYAVTGEIKPAKLSCEKQPTGTAIFSYGYPLWAKKVTSYGFVASDIYLDPANFSAGSTVLDITIAPGNSGGGIWNNKGELVGIADAVLLAPINGTPQITGYSVEIDGTTICGLMAKHK